MNQQTQNQQGFTEEEQKKKYGLQKVYENMNKQNGITKLMLGIDLTNFGLDLNDPNKKLHENFGFPFSDIRKKDPMNYNTFIPQCYKKPQTVLQKNIYQKFPQETLFYIFYNVPEEKYQQWAIEELYEKKWTYNIVLKTFFTDIKEDGEGTYSCKFFNVKKWGYTNTTKMPLDLQNDFISVSEFYSENNF